MGLGITVISSSFKVIGVASRSSPNFAVRVTGTPGLMVTLGPALSWAKRTVGRRRKPSDK
jgi:hypothetical protein